VQAAPAKPVAPQAPSTVPQLEVPVDVPSTLPPIDPNATPTAEPEYGTSAPNGPVGSGTDPVGTAPGSGEGEPFWFEDVERAATPLGRQRQPRYPEALRSARVEGGVTVTFVVDTLGRVEPASIRMSESAHALFEPAVQAALLQTRFRPARVRGGPVRQLVQQRFVFALTR
jgi:TonB family protein